MSPSFPSAGTRDLWVTSGIFPAPCYHLRFESYVLNWLSEEVRCKDNQYGGVKGCGVPHFLVDLWDEVAWNLEDDRATTLLTSIDYARHLIG